MIQNPIFGILFFFEKIISVSGIQICYIRPHISVDISRVLLLLFFLISSRKSQKQRKLGKNLTHFTIQFCLNNLTHFVNLNSLGIENNILSQHRQKLFSLYKFSGQHFSVWRQKKH